MIWDDYNPEPPEQEEPTEDEYCAMSGHEAHYELEDGLGFICHCGMVEHRLQGEPHDEYSAYCADLIDLYAEQLRRDDYRTPYDIRFEMGHLLRHKSPSWLLSLIASAKAHSPESKEGWVTLDEDKLDLFEKLGVHLTHTGVTVVASLVHRLSGKPGYGTWGPTGVVDPSGVLEEENNLELARRAARLYACLVPVGRGLYWEGQAEKAVLSMIPLLEKRPDLIEAVASLYNREGHDSSVTERALAMVDGEAVATTLAEGFL